MSTSLRVFDRIHAEGFSTASAFEKPSAAAKALPSTADSAIVAQRLVGYALWTIARWKSPALPGETRCNPTGCRLADVPASVTLPGSPPNCAMLSRTHRSAARSIQKAEHPRPLSRRDFCPKRRRQEPERPETVIWRDDDRSRRLGKPASVGPGEVGQTSR